jgi:hypothetical protein
MLYHVDLVRTDNLEERITSKSSVLTRATWHNIPEDGILHRHHCEYLKSYKLVIDLFYAGRLYHKYGFLEQNKLN